MSEETAVEIEQAAQDLTEEQKLELAACYAEYCGVDPTERSEWRTEMVGAKRFVRELMAIWKDRKKRN